jgi:hypothetical protein
MTCTTDSVLSTEVKYRRIPVKVINKSFVVVCGVIAYKTVKL